MATVGLLLNIGGTLLLIWGSTSQFEKLEDGSWGHRHLFGDEIKWVRLRYIYGIAAFGLGVILQLLFRAPFHPP